MPLRQPHNFCMRKGLSCLLPFSLHKITDHLEFFALDLIKVTTLTASVCTVFKMARSFLAVTAS
jgi:hypothetical protein